MIDQAGGRKFVGFIIIAILLTILVLSNKVNAQEFITFITLNYTAYVVGNVSENLTKK